ncbi:MAG: autotransporter outer membrane beta-barrel domain-containing protein, partial [Rhizobiales bacterium 35-68-8]
MLSGAPALAQSVWDPVISNTNWYVTVPQMLAYASGTNSFANPVAIGDQTLWALGTSVNGVFSGTSTGQLLIGDTYSYTTLTIQGTVTASGEILMVFTPSSGPVTIGLGRMAERGGEYEMEMQMITGTSVLVTHWAYMTSYDPATFTPPQAQQVDSNESPNWKWTAGTPWRMTSPGLFGSAGQGNLVITNYDGGYFWGVAVAPGGASAGVFTVLGSITPEGRVLLNTISAGQLYSLYGGIVGSPAEAAMLLGAYDTTGVFTGDLTGLTLVSSYAGTMLRQGNPAAFGAASTLYTVAGSLEGLFGPLAPTIAALNSLDGPALSTAISQTLPVLNGAGAQATLATQRALQQVVMSRMDAVHGAEAAGAERNVWLRPFGAFANQGTVSGVSGYSASGGGMAAGMDGVLDTGGLLGGVVAYSGTSITGGNSLVPNSLDVSTWQVGLYGAQALAGDLNLSWQLDLGYNRNSETRNIAFMGTQASADYDGWTGHAG